MSLKHSYSLIAPFYDSLVGAAFTQPRRKSLAHLPEAPSKVLLAGVGTGLDLPFLPPQHHYTGLDLTPAMLRRALPRAAGVDFLPVVGDAQSLPFADGAFDAAVLHLILAVVPQPPRCLAEIARVVRPGGNVLIFDKFLPAGRPAPLRRLANTLVRHIATRLDVVFEDVLKAAPSLAVADNQPALAGGWFRLIRLHRN